jgi:PAS domain S-box-containing protein
VKDKDKSKAQLIDELVLLRQQVAELKTLAAERKRAEEALRESEYKFRSVVEQSHDGIAVVDEQGIIAEWNQAMAQCTGLKAEEVLGRPIWDVQFHMNPEEQRTPEAYEQFKAGLLAFSKTGQAPWTNRVLERAYQHPDGTSRVIQGTIYSIKTDKGFILVSSARDVTEHRQAEEALRESEEKYRLVSENIPVVVYSALPDEHSTTLFMSGRIEELTGYSAQEFFDDPGLFTRMLHPKDREYVWEKIEEHRTNKITLDVEYRLITKDNTLK